MSYHTDAIDPNLLADAIEAYRASGELIRTLEHEARVPARTIYAVQLRERRISIDVADRLCLAMQIPLDQVAPLDASPVGEIRDGYCSACRDLVGVGRDRRCPWCEKVVPVGAKRGKPLDRHLRNLTPQLLASAYQVYARGASLRQVARLVFPRSTYSSPASCAQSLHDAWTVRGWKLRDRREAITRFNQRNGARPPKGTPEFAAYRAAQRRAAGEIRGVKCCATTKRGTPCQVAATASGEYCASHDPARLEENSARLADARARRASRRPRPTTAPTCSQSTPQLPGGPLS